MARYTPKRTRCPDCSRKTVIHVMRAARLGGDGAYCTWPSCRFEFFTSLNAGPSDREAEQRWQVINPGQSGWRED